MAFVPYVPNSRIIATTYNSSVSKMLPSSTSTFVYSKPVSNNTMFFQPWPNHLDVDECVNPELSCSQKPQETDSGQISHQKRTHFTVYQRNELEKTFTQSQYISPQRRRELSQKLGIPNEVIQTWFKNRRVKWRKEQGQRQTGASPHSASPPTGLYFHYFGHVPYPSSKLTLKDARMLYGPTTAQANDKYNQLKDR